MLNKLSAVILLLSMSAMTFAQGTAGLPKKSEADEKLEKEAVEFLRETLVDVGSMRSLENRISFGSEMASLMWFHDEKEAQAMYMGVMSDFKQLLTSYDQQMNAFASVDSPDEEYPRGGLFFEITEKGRIEKKFQTALGLRQQIALSLAEHEPDLAISFYYDSVAMLTSPAFRTRTADRDRYFEFQLMNIVAETNAAKAADYGKKALDKGLTYQHVELLKKIYAKDADKGADLASAMVSSLKSNKLKGSDGWVVNSLMQFGDSVLAKTKTASSKKPVLSEQDMRDLAELAASSMLDDDENFSGMMGMNLIEKYAPSRAAQIRSKLVKRSNSNSAYSYAMNSVNTVANAANSMANIGAYPMNSNVAAQRYAKTVADREAAEKKLMDDVSNLGTKALPKEERDKVVANLRKIIGTSQGVDKKIVGLSMLAAQVAKAGDKELASDIMKEAEGLVASQPKNYQDYLLTWILASGYADVDTDKSFVLLNGTILRLNDTIAAFAKAAEFIDTNREIIDDGEVQVGQFGGSMLQGISKDLNVARPTLRKLAIADFAKTKALTNNFDRLEVRILAKMLVLRAVLGGDEKKGSDETDIGTVLNEGL